LNQFVYSGIDDDGEHLYLVTEPFSSSVQNSQEALKDEFIVPTMKQVLKPFLTGIARLHKSGIAHTGALAVNGLRQ